MIKIFIEQCNLEPCLSIDELRSLGCKLVLMRNISGKSERYDFEVYVDEQYYLQVLDFLIYNCKRIIVKESDEDLTKSEKHFLSLLRMWSSKK